MKKIIISQEKLEKNKNVLKEEVNNGLVSFIYNRIMNRQTSLSHCGVFPKNGGMPFDYTLLKMRYDEVKNNLLQYDDIASTDEDYLVSYLSYLITRCQELEKPIENNLIKLCENIVIDLFNIPAETINLSCKLVKRIECDNLPLLPEDGGDYDYDFSKMLQFGDIKNLVLKRRFINSLIQGISYKLGTLFSLYDFDNEELIEMYKRIIAINDFILFTVKEEVNDKHPKQGAYVEVMLGREGEKTDINSQGIIFPLLLIETIRGFLELFASHGLPKDNDLARDVISHADFLVAEPWDLRYGVPLWEMFSKQITNPQIIPYYFSSLCSLHTREFNDTVKKILNNETEGKLINQSLVDKAYKKFEYQKFVDVMQKKNANISVITDDITNPDDLDNIIIQEKET